MLNEETDSVSSLVESIFKGPDSNSEHLRARDSKNREIGTRLTQGEAPREAHEAPADFPELTTKGLTMTNLPGDPGFWIERLLGASAGSLVSLIYMLPTGRREAFSRLGAGVISGVVFGGPAGVLIADRLGIASQLSSTEIMLSGAAVVSLCAWWALGLLERAAKKWVRKRME